MTVLRISRHVVTVFGLILSTHTTCINHPGFDPGSFLIRYVICEEWLKISNE